MEIVLPPKIWGVFQGESRYRGARGGRGSGKSLGFALMCLVKGKERRRRILCTREIQATIRDSVHRELVDAIEKFGFKDSYDYGESYIRGKKNGTEFLFKGLRHNFREIKSTANIDICWVEEAEVVIEESWRVLIPTIRAPGSEIWLTWNPEDPDSATQKRFIDDPPPNSKIAEVNYFDNPFFPAVLEEERQNDQRRYDRAMYRHVWLGKTLSKTGLEIYYNFNAAEHVTREAERIEAQDGRHAPPLLWSHDFNIGEGKPMSSCIGQIVETRRPDGSIRRSLNIFDEIVIETADTTMAAQEFRARYGNQGRVVVYGDASGRARDTRSKTTDYALLRQLGFPDQRVPLSNPAIRDRHNAVNALLRNAAGEVNLKIHPRCKTLIKGLRSVRLKAGATYIEEETFAQHVTTALGYLVNQEFPVVQRSVTVSGVSAY